MKRFAKKEIEVLENNLKLLKTIEKELKNFDTDSINETLPGSYRKAYDYLTEKTPDNAHRMLKNWSCIL